VTILLEGSKTWKKNPAGTSRIRDVLGNRDLFALCLAAIGHDVGHPGLSNAFMVRFNYLSSRV